MKPGQRYIRGIFAGGTFCYQAQQILQEGGVFAYSNAPLEGNHFLSDAARGLEHCLVDMGADEFTVGRPHPMIDPTLRRERLLAEAEDPEVAVILLDIILGYNASADPAGELTSAIRAAKEKVRRKGGYLSVVASVCGTDDDPQGLREQTQKLEETGAWVFPSSAQAAQFSVLLIHGRKETNHGR